MRNTLSVLAAAFLILPLYAYAESPALMSLYVFQSGEPVQGAELVVDGDVLGETNDRGVLHQHIDTGKRELVVRRGEMQLKQLFLDLSDAERLQIILAQPEGDAPVAMDLESSAGTRTIEKKLEPGEIQDTGTISGQVFSLQDNVPVSGVRVFVSGIEGATRTDSDGEYSIEVPAGVVSVSFVHPDFSAQVFKKIPIAPDQVLRKEIALTPSGEDLGEFVVTAPSLEGGFKALADEKRNSSSVKDVIGAEQISNSGDSDAAGALKRVTGLTLVDGKFIYVRGLGERYASTTMNGSTLPSPDPTRRVVPLDIFPTGVLSSVVIQKTYTPDMPGDFSGGVVQLRTLGEIPEEPQQEVSVSLRYNTETTGTDGDSYEGGGTDFLGIDDGTRAFPGPLDDATNGGKTPGVVSEEAAESLPQIYNVTPQTIPPDLKFKLKLADVYEPLNANYGWGYNFSLNYFNVWNYREEEINTYSSDGSGGVVRENDLDRRRTENEITLGGLFNLVFELGENSRLESNTILTRQSTNTVVIDEGFLSENELTVRDTQLEWVERQLFSQQFLGEHYLAELGDLTLDWHATVSQATRDEPDTRFYRYIDSGEGFTFTRDNVHQTTFEELTDDTTELAVNFTWPLYDLFGAYAELKFGLSTISRERDSKFLRFNFLTPPNISQEVLEQQNPENILNNDNIGGPDDFDLYRVVNATLPTDNYIATQTLNAMYLQTDITFNDDWSGMVGARIEDNDQRVTTFELANPDEKDEASIVESNVLPAASLVWRFSEDMQLRGAVSNTLNRPDFKELSSAPYIDPESRDVIIGNPNLVQAEISNFDIRWEWYLTHFETLSVSLFNKNFTNPIERTRVPGGGDADIYSFQNAEAATNTGIEIEGRAWLSRFFGSSMARFFVESNVAFIESEVTLGSNPGQLTNENRPLQGQSPWIFNFTLGYQNLVTRERASLLLNASGEYITDVGVSGIPDAYQETTPTLDFVYRNGFYEDSDDKMTFTMKVKNILDPQYEVTRGGEIENSYKKGITVSAGLKYSWK